MVVTAAPETRIIPQIRIQLEVIRRTIERTRTVQFPGKITICCRHQRHFASAMLIKFAQGAASAFIDSDDDQVASCRVGGCAGCGWAWDESFARCAKANKQDSSASGKLGRESSATSSRKVRAKRGRRGERKRRTMTSASGEIKRKYAEYFAFVYVFIYIYLLLN